MALDAHVLHCMGQADEMQGYEVGGAGGSCIATHRTGEMTLKGSAGMGGTVGQARSTKFGQPRNNLDKRQWRF